MSCQARTGLLVPRSCGQPSVAHCTGCGMALCGLHLGGGQCPDCRLASGNPAGDDAERDAATRNQYYETYGGPSQFGDAAYFSAGDRASLRPGVMGAGLVAGGAADYDPFET